MEEIKASTEELDQFYSGNTSGSIDMMCEEALQKIGLLKFLLFILYFLVVLLILVTSD